MALRSAQHDMVRGGGGGRGGGWWQPVGHDPAAAAQQHKGDAGTQGQHSVALGSAQHDTQTSTAHQPGPVPIDTAAAREGGVTTHTAHAWPCVKTVKPSIL
jgi:hypothetical protein